MKFLVWTVAAVGLLASARGECESQLAAWIKNASSLWTDHRSGDATLRVDWSALDDSMRAADAAAGCSALDELWLELWRVRSDVQRPSPRDGVGFGTDEYFARFNQCKKLDDGYFDHRGTARLDRRNNGAGGGKKLKGKIMLMASGGSISIKQ